MPYSSKKVPLRPAGKKPYFTITFEKNCALGIGIKTRFCPDVLVVTSVAKASAAARGGVKVGDIVLRIGDTPVTSRDDFAAILKKALSASRTEVFFQHAHYASNKYASPPQKKKQEVEVVVSPERAALEERLRIAKAEYEAAQAATKAYQQQCKKNQAARGGSTSSGYSQTPSSTITSTSRHPFMNAVVNVFDSLP